MRASGQARIALCGLALVVAGSVSAQVSPFAHTVRVATELEHDTNGNHSVSSPVSVQRFRIVPTYRARYVTGNEQLDFEGGVALERSSDVGVSQHRQDPRARVAWQHTHPLGSWRAFVAIEQRAYRATEVEERLPISVDGTRLSHSVGGDVLRELGEKTQLAGEFRHDTVKYDTQTATDYRLTTGSARWMGGLDDARQVYVAGDVQRYRATSDSAAFALMAPATVNAADVAGAIAGFRWSLGQFAEVQADAGASFYIQGSKVESRGSASLKYTRDRLQATLIFQRRPTVSSETSSLVQTSVARLSLAYEVGPSTRVRFEAATRKQRELNTRLTTVTLLGTHEITQNWELAVSAIFLDDELRTGRARGARIAVGLVYAPPL